MEKADTVLIWVNADEIVAPGFDLPFPPDPSKSVLVS